MLLISLQTMSSSDKPALLELLRPLKGKGHEQVDQSADDYLQYFDKNKVDSKKKEKSVEMTSHYYDIATDFYEYGWGDCFHFAPLRTGESREHALAKHEYKLALKLGLTSNDKVLVSIVLLLIFYHT